MKKVKSFAKTQLVGMILIALVPILFLGSFFIYHEFNTFYNQAEKVRERQYEDRKSVLKRRVEETLHFIYFKKSQQESIVRKSIKARVYEAHDLAAHLYKVYVGHKSMAEIKAMVREALRPIRFNDGKGYYFATSLDGVEELFADRPFLEGKKPTQP